MSEKRPYPGYPQVSGVTIEEIHFRDLAEGCVTHPTVLPDDVK